MKVRVILWKEFTDLSRDWRTLISTILLPLLVLPLLGFMAFTLTREQVTQIIVVVEDESMVRLGNYTFTATNFTRILSSIAGKSNALVVVGRDYGVLVSSNPYFDVAVIVPEDFIANATSYNATALLKIIVRVGSAKASEALSIVRRAVEEFNDLLGKVKVEYLARLAGVRVDYGSIRNPVKLSTPEYAGIGGRPASIVDELRAYTAKILMFALLFIAPPISSFTSDTIIGEKERKTLESLLVTPMPYTELLVGKIFAASILGALAALADVVGVLGYFYTLTLSYGGVLPFIDPQLVLVHSLVVFMTSLLTASLVMPLVLRSKTIRGAQASATAVTSIAMIVYFAVLFVDIPKLPLTILAILYLIPFTHPALIVYNYVNGELLQAIVHAIVTVTASLVLIALSVKMFKPEKILTSQ